MASTIDVVGSGSLGIPKYWSDKKRMVFHIHDFESLEDKQHMATAVSCHGHKWRLVIHPFGRDPAKEKERTMLSLHCSDPPAEGVEATFKFHFGNSKYASRATVLKERMFYGFDFLKRSDILSSVDDNGTLKVNVDLSIKKEKLQVWQPQNMLQQKMAQLFKCDEEKDVTFVLDKDVFVSAHKWMISLNCPTLHSMVESSVTGQIQLENVNGRLFALMIRFMYFNKLPNEEFSVGGDGLDLLKLANRFDYSDFKLTLEAKLVEADVVSVDNAAEILLLADSHSCALLKELSMKLVVENFAHVAKTKGWTALQDSSSLLTEVLRGMSGISESNGKGGNKSVSEMRKRLAGKGLDVDGTREMLVKRLKKSDEQSD